MNTLVFLNACFWKISFNIIFKIDRLLNNCIIINTATCSMFLKKKGTKLYKIKVLIEKNIKLYRVQ